MGLLSFFGGIFSAITVKTASSIDDVVWLACFVSPNEGDARKLHAMIYMVICTTQSLLAIAIARGGEAAIKSVMDFLGLSWSPDKVLTLIAGSFLSIYAVFLAKEYYEEHWVDDEDINAIGADEDDDGEDRPRTDSNYQVEDPMVASSSEGAADAAAPPRATKDTDTLIDKTGNASNGAGTCEQMSISVADIDEAPDGFLSSLRSKIDLDAIGLKTQRARSLAVIAFVGSLDDLTLFTPMLAGKAFGIIELLIGSITAAAMIVMLCVFITQCKPIADCLERVPLVAIVVVFAVTILVQGFTMN